ncbi:phosphoribosylglycinamide formyltransferase [Cyphellophora europaea CBS 101466]|uniref:Phosphoribosylglycinamide formyltransferase n=1 Tax=Cyphellophora europaea (strain CBS 101466) TaxID=1220924 RepID=W2RSF2_CYPE1|nr:phosphoribosylglycinamide formyltransferase [Cyphellophora europaea CBS 101466]ETN38678.1 phosphoribosylglycinamide formyltransferase [Cyphellophora europaea CBS 101466]
MSAPSTDQSRKYSTSSTFNITVLISGSGSNLQALIDACNPTGALPHARITHVISNRKDAYGLTRASNAHIPTTYHNLLAYKKKEAQNEAGVKSAREQYDADLAQIILTRIPSPDLVVCAGWMHILSGPFIKALQTASVPIINLHPALPGQFNGANAIQRAHEAFQRGEIASTGVMIHHVIGEVDMGRPIVTKEVECRPGEELSALEERIHQVEWKAIVEGVVAELKELEDERRRSS